MARLKFDPYDYLDTAKLKYSTAYTEAELRKAYSYLREIARKRMIRLEAAGYIHEQQYQILKFTGLPKLSEIANRSELVYNLRQTAFFVSLKQSTVSGIKDIHRERIKQFRELGVKGLNATNIDSFIKFLESAKSAAHAKGRAYDVEKLVNTYNYARRRKLDMEEVSEDFAWWQENIDTIQQEKIKRPKNAKGSDYIKKYLEKRGL